MSPPKKLRIIIGVMPEEVSSALRAKDESIKNYLVIGRGSCVFQSDEFLEVSVAKQPPPQQIVKGNILGIGHTYYEYAKDNRNDPVPNGNGSPRRRRYKGDVGEINPFLFKIDKLLDEKKPTLVDLGDLRVKKKMGNVGAPLSVLWFAEDKTTKGHKKTEFDNVETVYIQMPEMGFRGQDAQLYLENILQECR